MSGLSTDQQETYATLQGLGIPDNDARRAAQKYGGNIEAAANWCLNGAPPSPQLGPSDVDELEMPPPLVPADADADDNLPHPSTLIRGDPPPYAPSKELPPPPPAATEKILPAPFYNNEKKNPSLIDLTGSDDGHPPMPKLIAAPPSSPTARLTKNNDEDDDLQRALKASQADGDDDLTKAMALSMATLGSTDEEQLSVVDSIKPEERVREDMSVPPTLRSISALQSGFTAYLQSLYALPTWRNAILSYRTPDRSVLSGDDFKDYWRGDGGTLGMPMALGEAEERENRLIALQRLFALMTLTRRSFLHITDITRAFGLRESDFSYPAAGWVYKVKAIHDQIVEDLRICAGEEAGRLVAQGVSAEEAAAYEKKALDRFTVNGRSIRVDDHLADDLSTDVEAEPTAMIDIPLNPVSPTPETLYTQLDSRLVHRDTRTTPPTLVLDLMTNHPATLVFNIEREVPAITSLESFGSGAGARAKQERKVFRPTPEGEGDADTVWMDRYAVGNRVAIAKAREEVVTLEAEKGELEKRRREVGETKDGRDARELVRGTVEFLGRSVEAAGEEGKEAGEEEKERRERQRSLREQWEKVGVELDGVLASYDSSLSALSTRISSLFSPSSTDESGMRPVGPYRLHAILMRNGLNGRGSAWSVVKGEDGRWWKIVDLVKEETTLEKALSDPSGLMMDAGSTFLLYQRADEDVEPVPVPLHLQRIAHLDNHSFASTLPPSSADLISNWSLPPLTSLAAPEPEAIPIPLPLAPSIASDDADAVQDVVLDTPSPEPEEVPQELMVESLPPPVPAPIEKDERAETPMSVDDATSAPAANEDEGEERDALRLRGGASVEEEEEEEEEDDEEYDDEEIDEDEVELGLLQPMPEDWDVDYAVGKVGGLPKWLDPRSPLGVEDVTCGECGRAMGLLLQVNSPDDTRPHAAARSLYVFACRGKNCLSRGGVEKAVRVWRTQMPSPNEFYPHTEETLKLRKELEEKLDPETQLAGKPEKKVEPFPEFDVGAEPEPYEESYLPDPSQPAGEKEEGTEDAAEPDTKTGVDTAFLTFQERIEREPKQVLRFYRLPGIDDPQPLWASATKIRPEEVSTCELCRGERKIEFQILSTLLPSLKDDYLDFDSLLVYTCLNHCEIPKREGGKTGWAVECAFKQDFAAEGVKFGMQQLRRDLPQA
ncbi:hypothetical protein JCM6882_008605 [Rhodosporidiobolus microsporus]